MPTYVMLANWTEQGMRAINDSPKRIDAAKQVGDFRSRFVRHKGSNCQAKKTGGGQARSAKFLLKLLNGRSQ